MCSILSLIKLFRALLYAKPNIIDWNTFFLAGFSVMERTRVCSYFRFLFPRFRSDVAKPFPTLVENNCVYLSCNIGPSGNGDSCNSTELSNFWWCRSNISLWFVYRTIPNCQKTRIRIWNWSKEKIESDKTATSWNNVTNTRFFAF